MPAEVLRLLPTGGAAGGPAYEAPRSTMERLASFDAGRKENAPAAVPWAGAVVEHDAKHCCPDEAPLQGDCIG